MPYIGIAKRASFHSRSAYTLVEIMVVLGILALLMAILVPFLTDALITTKQEKTDAALATIWSGIEAFKSQYKAPPDPNGNCASLVIENPGSPGTQITIGAYVNDAPARFYMALTTNIITQSTVREPFLKQASVKEFARTYEDSSGNKVYEFVDGHNLPIFYEVNNYGGTNYLCLRSYGPNGVKDPGDPDEASYSGDDQELRQIGTMTLTNQ
ncbi:MAG: type II secretion system GspH family protein [Planctomycetes bacterium]|nr:type II secretion system GspH family protein [Planctomycetota bacterium]